MEVVRSAALAPAQPSGQDRSVAAQATRNIAAARSEQAKTEGGDEPGATQDQAAPSGVAAAPAEKSPEAYTNGLRAYARASEPSQAPSSLAAVA